MDWASTHGVVIMKRSGVVGALLCLAGLLSPAHGQEGGPTDGVDGTPLTIDEAIQLALNQSFAVRIAREDLALARGQVEEAWGSVYPKVDLTGRYTHTFETPNLLGGDNDLFGGFDDIFGGLQTQSEVVGWLAYNESVRQLGGQAISLDDFLATCSSDMPLPGCPPPLDTGGLGQTSGNPFLIEDQVNVTLAISQVIYSGRAFTAIQAAEILEEQQLANIRRDGLETVAEAVRTYYGAQLAREQVAVTRKGVERLEETLAEITRRVEQGLLPEFQQLSTEVEVANLRSRLAVAEAQAADAVDAVELSVGLPVEQETRLRTPLALPAEPVPVMPLDEALEAAMEQRPDLESLDVTRRVLATQIELTRADYLPIVSAFANIGAQGPGSAGGSVFDLDDWGPSVNAGIALSWNLFGGFTTDAQIQQQSAELRKVEVQIEQVRAGARLQIVRALRAVDSAKRRLDAQNRVVERAELNYSHAEARIRQGVSTTTELRDASQQLDESRLNRLQAVHDLLIAWIDYEVAIGTPPAELRAVRTGPKEAP